MDLEPIDVIFDGDEIALSDRVTGTRDNPTFNIIPPITDCVGVALLYTSIPFTYYVIDNTCNQFQLGYQSLFYTCTLTPGTYNAQNIGGEFIASISRAANATVAGQFTAFVDNTDMNFVVYNNTAGTGTAFNLNFNVINSAFQSLGFNQQNYISSATTFYDNTETAFTKHNVIAPRVINLTGPGQMYLNSDLGGNLFGKVRNQTAAQGLVGFWPVNANYTGTIESFRENPMRIPIGRTNISTISLKLLLGNRTQYNSGDGTGAKDYLQLNGEAFKVAIRFFRLAAGERVTTDSAGNSTTSTTEMGKSSVYRPPVTTTQQIMGSRFRTTQDAFSAQRASKRTK
jgi:hypothetical protein